MTGIGRPRRRPQPIQAAASDRGVGQTNSLKPWLTREIARERDVTHSWTATSLQMPNGERLPNCPILRDRSQPGQRIGELWQDMLDKDGPMSALYTKLRESVLVLTRSIKPGDDSPKAAEAAKFARLALGRIPQWALSIDKLLEKRQRGLSILEIEWERAERGPLAGGIVPVDVVDRPMHRFAFDLDSKLHVRRPTGPFLPAPPMKFLVGRHGTKDDPWGKADLAAQYWPTKLILEASAWWTKFLEAWADPMLTATYRHKPGAIQANANEQARAVEVLQALRKNMNAAIPEGIVIGMLESTRSGSVSYETFISTWRRWQALIALGEVLLSGADKGTGAYASYEIALDVFVSRVKLEAHWLASYITESILQWITWLNFGFEVTPPRMSVEISDTDARNMRIEGLKLAREWGLAVPEDYVRSTLLAPEPMPGEKVFENAAVSPDSPDTTQPEQKELERQRLSARFAAETQIDDSIEEALSGRAAEIFAARIDQIVDHYAAGLPGGLIPVANLFGSAFGDLMHAAATHGLGSGLSQSADDGLPLPNLQTEAEELDARRSAGLRAAAAPPPPVEPTAAADWWANLTLLPKPAFLQLGDELRRAAYTMAGVLDVDLLTDTYNLVGQAQAEGWDRTRFREELAAAFARRGAAPTSTWHADLVLNNNLRQTAGAVRRRALGTPGARRAVPYLQFRTVFDEKVRARPEHHHQIMSGLRFANGHPIWDTWWYPAGHGCRCLVVAISAPAARREGLVGMEPDGPWPQNPNGTGLALPDPGFRGGPRLSGNYDSPSAPELEARRALDERLTEARGLPTTTGLESLPTLLEFFLRLILPPELVQTLFGDKR